MTFDRYKSLIAAALLVAPLSIASIATAQESAPGPIGKWRMGNGKITVQVDYCGGENLCATIVGMSRPLDKNGQPKLDKENPNPSLRSRPVMGLQIMDGMKPSGENRWKGKIYNADDGGTYTATASLAGNRMTVKGCWTVFCKKMRFTRIVEVANP
jgi:uncharacterized protein (DUF2147 family)